MQNSEKFDSKTSKPQPVNLSELSRHPACVHQRVADSLQSFKCFFLLSKPYPSTVRRQTNGLFHSRCPDFHANEKIIIFKLALSQ